MSKWASKRSDNEGGSKSSGLSKSLNLASLKNNGNRKKSAVDNYRWDLTSPAVSRKAGPVSPAERRLRKQYAQESYEAKEAGKKEDIGLKLEPKVYVAYDAKPGHTQRRVAVERKKQFYAAQDLQQILNEKQITNDMIRSHFKFLPERFFQSRLTPRISTPFAAQVTLYLLYIPHELGETSVFTCIPHPLKIS